MENMWDLLSTETLSYRLLHFNPKEVVKFTIKYEIFEVLLIFLTTISYMTDYSYFFAGCCNLIQDKRYYSKSTESELCLYAS